MPEVDLRTAIERAIAADGEKDPYAVVDRLEEVYGKEWAKRQAMVRYREVIAREASGVISRARRDMQRAIRDSEEDARADLMERSLWVPTKGGPVWKRIGDFTAADHRCRLAWLRRLGGAVFAQAAWHENIVAMMAAAGAERTDELDGLPEMPQVGPPGHPRLELEEAS